MTPIKATKKFRWWLAEKLIGSPISTMEEEKTRWIEEHLKEGGHVHLSYEVRTVQ